MEIEFDKEIDAILRRARRGAGVAAASADHLDADTVAAFAENALPENAKLLAVGHFADCDRCRKQLSFVMRVNKEAAVAAAAAPAVEPVVEASIPWYQSLFKTPNLALAMGALVLVFSGILGYLVIQKRAADSNATVSQVTVNEKVPNVGEENTANEAPLSELVATAVPTPPAPNTAANSAARVAEVQEEPLTRADSDAQGKLDASRETKVQLDGVSESENRSVAGGVDAGAAAQMAAKPAAAPPPKTAGAPVTTDTTSSMRGAERDEKQPVDDGRKMKEEGKDLELAKKQNEGRGGYRDMPRAAAKAAGPSRAAGPVQGQLNQNQMNSNMPVTRVVGGRIFNNRDGAWYDSAYHGQATVNYRRGTAEYKKLDSGLRNIADTLGGTVVVVWKAKAYRIQ